MDAVAGQRVHLVEGRDVANSTESEEHGRQAFVEPAFVARDVANPAVAIWVKNERLKTNLFVKAICANIGCKLMGSAKQKCTQSI